MSKCRGQFRERWGDGVRIVKELAAVAELASLSPAEVEEIRAIGDNSGCMALKGASPEYAGPGLADRWRLDQPEPGVLVWHTPAGRTYDTEPTRYPI